MPVSTVAYIREKIRQKATFDDSFYKKFTYFFELELPPVVAYQVSPVGSFSFFFPLILPPSSHTLSEPFAMEKTATQGGGL